MSDELKKKKKTRRLQEKPLTLKKHADDFLFNDIKSVYHLNLELELMIFQINLFRQGCVSQQERKTKAIGANVGIRFSIGGIQESLWCRRLRIRDHLWCIGYSGGESV